MPLLFESGRKYHQVFMIKSKEVRGILDTNNEFTKLAKDKKSTFIFDVRSGFSSALHEVVLVWMRYPTDTYSA